jgi:hypothetical protein
MRSLKAAILAAGAFVIFTASSAFAGTISYTITGPVWTGGSWSAPGTLIDTSGLGTPNGIVKFDKAVFTRTGGNDVFEVGGGGPGAGKVFDGTVFAPASATESAGSTGASATVLTNAAPGNTLLYKLILAGAGTGGETISYRIDLFSGAVQTALATVTSTVQTDHSVITVIQITDNIPVPPAVWTGVAMLGGMMFLVRRRNRKVLA